MRLALHVSPGPVLGFLKGEKMSLGYDPELPAGLQDADIEMADLQRSAEAAARREKRTKELATAIRSTATTEKDMPMKDGSTVRKGAAVWFIPGSPDRCYVQGEREEPYRVRVRNAFKVPDQEQLEEWVNECGCETVAGEWTEPDGWTNGAPSWLLALGMI